MNDNEIDEQIGWHIDVKVFTYLKEVRTHSLAHFALENFMDLSTWDFDPHLLDLASLSKHVAYESVDRFVTHT